MDWTSSALSSDSSADTRQGCRTSLSHDLYCWHTALPTRSSLSQHYITRENRQSQMTHYGEYMTRIYLYTLYGYEKFSLYNHSNRLGKCNLSMVSYLSPCLISWRFLPSNETQAEFRLPGATLIWGKHTKQTTIDLYTFTIALQLHWPVSQWLQKSLIILV